MLYFDIRRVLELRGIDKPYTFLIKNGFVSQTATNMVNNRLGRIIPEQMEKLCLLLHCTPNDLFDWDDDKKSVVADNHPLRTLIKEKSAPPISEMVRDLPVEKLGQLAALIDDLKNSE
jgi:DNA-binding Xre family transcriptional regulator